MKMGQDRTEKTHLVWTCKARSVSSISLTKRTNHKVCVKARKESIISRTVALKNKILYVFMIMSILCVTLLQSFDSSGSELVEKTTFEIKSKTIICYDSHPVSGCLLFIVSFCFPLPLRQRDRLNMRHEYDEHTNKRALQKPNTPHQSLSFHLSLWQ